MQRHLLEVMAAKNFYNRHKMKTEISIMKSLLKRASLVQAKCVR